MHGIKKLISKITDGATVARKHKLEEPGWIGLKVERRHWILEKLVSGKVKFMKG
jgi:hypothetical protein